MSKVAMSTFGRILALENPNLFVANVCPGMVKTDMTSQYPHGRPLEQGAWIVSHLGSLENVNHLKNGGFYAAFCDKKLKRLGLNHDDWEQVMECVELDYVSPKFSH